MEQFEAEKDADTTQDEITSKVKVLAIGDEKCLTTKKPIEKYNKDNIKIDFVKHLGLLLVGTRKPIDVIDNWDMVSIFTARSIKKDNQPRRYHFYCSHKRFYKSSEIISGPTINGQAVMEYLRKRLKDENWISNTVIETPLKTFTSRDRYFRSDQYIQKIVSEALNAEQRRLLQFVQYLQSEHVKNKYRNR